MDERQKKKKLKIAITILAVLLGMSVAALAGTLIYKHLAPAGPSSVIIPDNLITPDAKKEQDETADIAVATDPAQDESTHPTNDKEETVQPTDPETSTAVPASPATESEEAMGIYLYSHKSSDNTPFSVDSMFPGDMEIQRFCVRVSYKDDVTVNYHAGIQPGYEKLAEVLNCRIVLLTTGETMYDGLMRDMPERLGYNLSTSDKTTTDLYYEVTAYLDTSVGNEYQNKELIADFRWWVEEEDHLAGPPDTGDNFDLMLCLGLMIGSLFILILLFVARKKEERHEQYR